MLTQRLALLQQQLLPAASSSSSSLAASSSSAEHSKSDDDIVVISALRTPLGRGRRGTLKDTTPDELLRPLFQKVNDEFFSKMKDAGSEVGDVVVGTVLPPGGFGATQVRVAQLLAGFPKEIPCSTVNRQCVSSIQSIVQVAGAIKAGLYECGLACGVESMSMNWNKPMPLDQINPNAMEHDLARGCYMSMGMTSEEVAKRYKISRAQQDAAAVESHRKAHAATTAGYFKDEIVPVTVNVRDKEGNEKKVTLDRDEGIRPNTTAERLAKLKPAFIEEGTTTAGNASQVSDGAAVLLVASRRFAKRYNFPILGRFVTAAAVGVEPAVMGIGPAVAIPLALKKANLKLSDIDLFEINEAFASQFVYSVQHLGIDWKKVNIHGGAMAIGHPLGATGARFSATLLHALKRTKKRFGVVSACVGTGMGMAAIFESE
eukprot:CAMPEP_0201552138 /NCGR_PEP_ID=MMETSP0173_2-20130828/14512_1 /ASSEMBLY_ACC=CAM_ASM_000268 /TAXON_ID=218659 /ORGANISM="Vexillifera sp., Strain DIVA3 564/2" /LENGTH=430 /DNA_ID=CAMNT_0047962567 /DNA_START=14 /DNA_END=1306 /DNA_ORIENTATION=+